MKGGKKGMEKEDVEEKQRKEEQGRKGRNNGWM